MRALVLAQFTFREALRKRVLLAAIGLSLAFLTLYGVGVHYGVEQVLAMAGRSRAPMPSALVQYQFSQMMLAGLWVVNFLAGLLVVFTSVGTLAGEIESGTFHAIVSKPISRWEVVVGKWLGHAAMVLGYVLLMSSAIVLIVSVQSGYVPDNLFAALGTLWLEMLLLLSLSLLVSALLSTITAGIAVLMLYGIGMVGGMVKWIGTLMRLDTMVAIGDASSYLLPSDALWRHTASLLEAPSPLPLGASPFSGAPGPAEVLIPYTALYAAAMVVGASLIFQRKDL